MSRLWLASILIFLPTHVIGINFYKFPCSENDVCECSRSITLNRTRMRCTTDNLRDILNAQRNATKTIPRNIVTKLALRCAPKCKILKKKNLAKFSTLKKLELSYNGLEKVDGNLFDGLRNLQELDLSDNMFSTIPVKTFRRLKSLEKLDLNSNYFESIPMGLDLPKLKSLNLNLNSLEKLQPYNFKKLAALEKVSLDHNLLRNLPENAFAGLKSLKELLLNYNPIEKIENGAFTDLENLKFLFISKGKIESLNADTFLQCRSLTDLDLSDNGLSEIHGNAFVSMFGGVKNLQVLLLLHNKLEKIEGNTFSEMPNLDIIDLSNNRITEIDDQAFSTPDTATSSLKTLILKRNRIAKLGPDVFRNLETLEHLDLSVNRLESISPSHFRDLSSLKHLDLGANRIENIAKGTFNNLDHLFQLGLGHNQLQKLEKIGKMKSLYGINLMKNNISSLQTGTFSGDVLGDVDLSYNIISSLEEGVFQEAKNLQRLNLKVNKLAVISKDAFKGMTWLTELQLANNQITSFEPDAFKDLKSLKKLDLQTNRLQLVVVENARVTLESENMTSLPNLSIFDKLHFIPEVNLNGNPQKIYRRGFVRDYNQGKWRFNYGQYKYQYYDWRDRTDQDYDDMTLTLEDGPPPPMLQPPPPPPPPELDISEQNDDDYDESEVVNQNKDIEITKELVTLAQSEKIVQVLEKVGVDMKYLVEQLIQQPDMQKKLMKALEADDLKEIKKLVNRLEQNNRRILAEPPSPGPSPGPGPAVRRPELPASEVNNILIGPPPAVVAPIRNRRSIHTEVAVQERHDLVVIIGVLVMALVLCIVAIMLLAKKVVELKEKLRKQSVENVKM